jgi:hypothetical protein
MGMLHVDLRVTIRLKVATGILPKDAPAKMFAGYGTPAKSALPAISRPRRKTLSTT